jgi:hypothetical protein
VDARVASMDREFYVNNHYIIAWPNGHYVRMDVRMNGRTVVRMDVRMDVSDGRSDERSDGRTDGRYG